MEFKPFNKIPRLFRDVVITEKLDGTNASIHIISLADLVGAHDGHIVSALDFANEYAIATSLNGNLYMFAASRTRWLKVAKNGKKSEDNYGFAGWVAANSAVLFYLGEGVHHGEWWGQGIQRGYGLKEKRFSLFNTDSWNLDNLPLVPGLCVVPHLYSGAFQTDTVIDVLTNLNDHGSYAAHGFMKPEGIVLYHTAAGNMFKVTLENDGKPKGAAQ